ncbi:hypothetical protein [Pareuzebyella sediminis]|uniref:hypothetical protein n=1 Tax=Pareuzebyella sediminis TaxID=2607998 RepID=UPI0011ED4118|nr:hypothetical protein [Pareuzebyella sediminis]
MAKIEIKGTPEKLERVSIFLKANNIQHSIVDDFGNHSKEDSDKYRVLMSKYNALSTKKE